MHTLGYGVELSSPARNLLRPVPQVHHSHMHLPRGRSIGDCPVMKTSFPFRFALRGSALAIAALSALAAPTQDTLNDLPDLRDIIAKISYRREFSFL